MKLKTCKSAAKRIKVRKSGKYFGLIMSAQHRAKGKSKKVRRKAMANFEISSANIKTIKKLIPN